MLEADKVAKEIIKAAKYEDLGGLDSDQDEDDLDEELRDEVTGAAKPN